MATNNREPWPWEQAAPANVWQISPQEQYERDQVRKRMLEDELAQERQRAQAGDQTAPEQVQRLQREIGNDTRYGRYAAPAGGSDVVTNPFAKDQPTADREPWPWEQAAPAASRASLEGYESPYAIYSKDFGGGPAKTPTRNPAAVINDYVIEAANAVLGLGKSIIDFAKPGTELADQIQSLIDYGRNSQSLITQEAKKDLEAAIDQGGWEAVKGVGRYVVTSPGLAASQVAGSVGPIGRAIKAGTAIGGARAGLGVGAGIGAVTAGGDAAGNAYDMVRQAMLQQGYDPLVADEAAREAARRASVAPAILGGVTGMFGMERVLSGLGRGGALRTGLSEGLQEFAEEGGTQLSANLAAQPYVPGLEATRGVLGSGALGFALGGMGGAAVGLMSGRPVDMLTGRSAPAGEQTTPTPSITTPTAPTFSQVETDPNRVPREVAPGVYFTPSTGLYTLAENTPGIAAGRTMARPTIEEGPYDLLGAGAPNVNVNQGTLPGIAPVLDQNIPTAADIEQMALGAQPGQQEMFMPNGQPTYGAAEPDTRALAEARLQAEGLKPTDKRVDLAVKAEEALAVGAIDEDTYDQIFSLLRESKYGRVGKMLTGARSVTQTAQAQQTEAQGSQTAIPATATTVAMPEEQVAPAEQNIPTPPSEPMAEAQAAQAVEQQETVADNVTALEQTARAIEAQIRGIDGQMMSMLSKSGRTPIKGTAKAKQYSALGDQRVALRQQLDQVNQEINAQRAPTPMAAPITAPVALTTPVTEAPNAVQVQGATEVPVQSRAEAGTRVGEKVRGAQESTAESQQAEVGQAEEAVTEGAVTRKQAIDRLVQEGGMARSDAIKYVNSVVDGFGQVRTADIQGLIDENKAATAKGGKPVYSRGAGQPGKTSTQQVEDWVRPSVKQWKGAPPVRVVQAVTDLDPALNAPADAKGVFYKGEVIIVADNAKNQLDAMTTLLHEVVGHYGFRSLVRAESTEYVRILTQLESQNARIREQAKLWRENNQESIKNLKKEFGYTDTMVRALSVEEAMADMAYEVLQTPAMRTIFAKTPALRSFVQWIAKALRSLGMAELANKIQRPTDNLDVFALLSMAKNSVETGNKTTITTAKDIPLFSRDKEQASRGTEEATMQQPAGRVQQNLNQLPKPVQRSARVITGALEDAGGRFLDMAVFTNTLVKRAVALGMNSARKFEQTLAARGFMAREEERNVEKILDYYSAVPESERGTGDKSVNRFIFDSTRTGKWGYDTASFKADEDMAARFDALSPESQKFVKEVFAHGDRILARKKELVLKATSSEYDAQIVEAKTDAQKADLEAAKKAALARYRTLFDIREGLPYAPIKRNGNYVVIAKSKEYLAAEAAKDTARLKELESDDDHYHVSFTDGKFAGRELQAQLQEQGAFEDVQLAQRDTVSDELFSNEGALQQLSKLRSGINARVEAGDTSAGKLLETINQMYLEALAETSARKSEMRRRGVAGEVDMVASFAQQGRADANFLASLQYGEQINDILNDMRSESKRGDRTRKTEVLNELVKRYVQSFEVPNNNFTNKLTRLSSLYFLTTSPAYYLQNLTQPFMMSLPQMASVHGYIKSANALLSAYTDLGPVLKSAKLFKGQLDYSKVPEDVREVIDTLVNRGVIDIGLDTELGEFKVDSDSRLGQKWNAVDKGMRMAVQKGEAVNRLSTAIAAYRLAMSKKGATKADAIDYAEQIINDTHGNYSRVNAPRAFNTQLGKVALQFRKFQLLQLSWYAKMFNEAFGKDKDATQRWAAIKSLGFALTHTGVLAGAMGLPGYAAIAYILQAAFGDDDEPYDLTDEIRKMIDDPEIANVVLRGAPVLGGADISGKVGSGNMLSIMPFSNADLTTRSGFYEALGTVVGGASAGMVVRGVDGLGLLANGDYMKGMEMVLPKGLGDAIKAYRLSEEGATRRNGDVILPADEIDPVETAMQALGFQPAQISEMYEKQTRVRETEQMFKDRTTRIKNDYAKAVRAGDSEGMSEAREAWLNLQAAKAKVGLRRSPMSDLIKAPREQRKRERETAGGVQFQRPTRRFTEEITER